jgi:hypothetical protein
MWTWDPVRDIQFLPARNEGCCRIQAARWGVWSSCWAICSPDSLLTMNHSIKCQLLIDVPLLAKLWICLNFVLRQKDLWCASGL